MIIKICGMRDEKNTREVERLDVDWMGFIFYPKSPRYTGGRLSYIPERVKRAGVFVDACFGLLLDTAARNRLDMIQLHGEESPCYCEALRMKGFPVIKSFGIASNEPFPSGLTDRYEGYCDYFLFDTKTSLYGGSGKKFEWETLSDYRGETPFLLSGGISPDDAEAIKLFSHPKCIGIDLNSGVEISPAVKNVQLLHTFIKTIRGDDAQH